MTRIFLLIKGYGSTKEKLLFLLTILILGVFILAVYVICQMVQGVQQVSNEATPLLDENGNPYDAEGLNEEIPELTNSYNNGQYN